MKKEYFYNTKHTGNIIRQIRTEQRVSQMKLAEICSISESHLRKIEAGTTNISLDVLVSICNSLDIPLEYLFTHSTILQESHDTGGEILSGLNSHQQLKFLQILECFIYSKEGE